MTGKERVRRAFEHIEPDRTPLYEGLIKSPVADHILGRPSILSNVPYRMEVLSEASWEEVVEMEAREVFDLARYIGLDMVRLGTNLRSDFTRPLKIKENLWRVGDSLEEYLPESYIVRRRPLKPEQLSEEEQERCRLEELEKPLGLYEFRDEEFRVWRRVMELFRQSGVEVAIYAPAYTMPVATLPEYMFRWFQEKPKALHKFYERCMEGGLHRAKRYAEEGADVIGLGGDVADDHGPMISPAYYDEFIGCRIREQARALKPFGLFVTNTSDGNLWKILDEFLIKTEVNGYGEIDKAGGMDLGELKEKYGDTICFIGNLDIRYVLCRGTPQDARREMIECIEAGMGNGGHIIASSNCIHADVKVENYLSAIEAYREFFGLK